MCFSFPWDVSCPAWTPVGWPGGTPTSSWEAPDHSSAGKEVSQEHETPQLSSILTAHRAKQVSMKNAQKGLKIPKTHHVIPVLGPLACCNSGDLDSPAAPVPGLLPRGDAEPGDLSPGAGAIINNRKRAGQQGQETETQKERKRLELCHFHFCCTRSGAHAVPGVRNSTALLHPDLLWDHWGVLVTKAQILF